MSNNPLVSICLIAYNQEKYVGAAIDSIFSQTYTPVEIILSDDNSTDQTYEIIKEKATRYKGVNNVITNRNSNNLGLAQHVNKVALELSNGDYIHLAAGDDIMFSDKIQETIKIMQNNTDIVAVGGQNVIINDLGEVVSEPKANSSALTIYSLKNYLIKNIHISHRTFKREVFTFFGPLQPNCPTEDTTLLLRSFLLGNVALMHKPAIYYRIHEKGISFGTNIYKLNFQHIYEQYNTDIDFAYAKGIISINQKRFMHRIKKNNYIFHKLMFLIDNEKSKLKLYLKWLPRLLISRHIKTSKKYILLKKIFF